MDSTAGLVGADLSQGVKLEGLEDGKALRGHVGEEAVMLVRRGSEVFALNATCSHYGGPLDEGLVVGDTVRCPWHHACFSLRTGEALQAPALSAVTAWRVEQRDGQVFVREKLPPPAKRKPRTSPDSVVIVGAGAAGHAAAEMLRREGYAGPVRMVSADQSPPVDRPNLSKDYLAGKAPEEWIPMRPPAFYEENAIELILGKAVSRIDVAGKSVTLIDGTVLKFGALLLATGADPVRLTLPGAELPHVHVLRSLADCRSIIGRAKTATHAVVLGTSFIGLEVAAALRTRGLQVTVVGPHAVPLEPILGPEVGAFVRGVHEAQGVSFRMGQTLRSIDSSSVTLASGETLPAELVVAGLGVRPALSLAQLAGLRLENGLLVNEYLETSAAGIYAAGDIARWPDARFGGTLRVEHWVVAQRLGQAAARNILGAKEKFNAVPFFWSSHYDMTIGYVGHAAPWESIAIDGSLEKRDCTVRYSTGGKLLAVATIGRDLESLKAELAFERA